MKNPGIKKDMAYRKEVRMAANEAAMVERKKQTIATAVAREQQRGKAARTVSKSRSKWDFTGGINAMVGTSTSKKKPLMMRL